MSALSERESIRSLFVKVVKAGFLHIVGSGFLNAVLMLLLNIAVIRILPVEDYGSYSYAYSIASMFILFNALGASPAALQICSERFENKLASEEVFSYAYKAGSCVDAIFAMALICIGVFVPMALEGSNILLVLYCCYPLLMFLNEMKLSYQRIWLRNRQYGILTNIRTVLLVVFSIAGSLIAGAIGFVGGQNLALIVCWIISCCKYPYRLAKGKLDRGEKIDFWKIALLSSVNNGLGGALSLLGTFLVGSLLLSDTLVAYYNAACVVPFGLLFLPTLVVVFVYPYFVRNKDNRNWTIRSYAITSVSCAAVFGIIAAIMFLFSDQIIVLLYGDEYLSASAPFKILTIGFWITASFRRLGGNLLASQRKLFANTISGVISIIVMCASSFAFIPQFGIVGAAWAYTLTMTVGAFFNTACYTYTIARLPQISE